MSGVRLLLKPVFLAATLVAACSVASTAQAAGTVTVPSQYPTIQQAIDAVPDGWTIQVAPGTYTENIDFDGKNLHVRSEGGSSVTTIDGGGNDVVVRFNSGESSGAVLEGFTITNGMTTSSGGGIQITHSSPTIKDNTVSNNESCLGAGVIIDSASPLVVGNLIAQNTTIGLCSGGLGAGILINGSGSAQVRRNRIEANKADSGAGIYINAAGTPTIESNIITGNTAYGHGGGILAGNNSQPRIIQNVIAGNTATGYYGDGGGVWLSVPGGTLTSNTIADNQASNPGNQVWLSSNGLTIVNNIIAGAQNEAVYCQAVGSQPPTFSHNLFFSGANQSFGGVCTDPTGSNGNLTDDPDFFNAPNGPYHLASQSPAIDAADPAAPLMPALDIDGLARVLDGNGDDIAVPDIGADEWAPNDPDLDGIPSEDDLCNTEPGPPELEGCPAPLPIGGSVTLATGAGRVPSDRRMAAGLAALATAVLFMIGVKFARRLAR